MIRNWVNPSMFRVLDAKRGPRTMNLSYRFFYRVEPSASALWLQVCFSWCRCVDAFVRDWSGKDNWISFPVGLVPVAQDIFECDLAYYVVCLMWHILCLIWHIVVVFVSLIWHIFQPDMAYLCAWCGLFLSVIRCVSSHFGVGSFWACNTTFSILLCADMLLSASLLH